MIFDFVCIDCGGKVKYFPLSVTSGYFLCKACQNLHLRQNEISVFLPISHENKKFFDNFFLKYSSKINPKHRLFFIKKSKKIAKNTQQNWEDEDVRYWNEQYKNVSQKADSKTQNLQFTPRDIARKIHLFDFISKNNLEGKIVCEIGTGQAESIRELLNPNNFPYYYIPTDYSYQALVYLKNIFGENNRIYYIQCLGDRLPFQKKTIDYLLILGVLHHMPKKEKHIKVLASFVKPNGLLLIEEPYLRDSKISNFLFEHSKFIFEPKHSAHEERPQKKLLLNAITKAGDIMHIHHLYSPLMTVAMFLFNKNQFLQNNFFLKGAFLLDQLWIGTMGKIFPAFDSGQCQVVIKSKMR